MAKLVRAPKGCALEEALEAAQTREEHLYESEVYRLKGELLLQQSTAQQGEAEEHLQQALTVARLPAGQVPGAARGDEPGTPLAAPGQACRSP